MSIFTRLLRGYGRKAPPIPFGWALVEYRDFKNAMLIAPFGLHWIFRFAIGLHVRIEWKWSLAISNDLLSSTRYTRSPLLPFCIDIEGDNLAQRRGYGLAWEWETKGSKRQAANGLWSGETPAFGRVIAPIGLNLVYAVLRWIRYQ